MAMLEMNLKWKDSLKRSGRRCRPIREVGHRAPGTGVGAKLGTKKGGKAIVGVIINTLILQHFEIARNYRAQLPSFARF